MELGQSRAEMEHRSESKTYSARTLYFVEKAGHGDVVISPVGASNSVGKPWMGEPIEGRYQKADPHATAAQQQHSAKTITIETSDHSRMASYLLGVTKESRKTGKVEEAQAKSVLELSSCERGMNYGADNGWRPGESEARVCGVDAIAPEGSSWGDLKAEPETRGNRWSWLEII
jgi:hypothetical protein